MTRMLRLVAVALLLVAVGCGDSGGDIAETGTTIPSDETTTTGTESTESTDTTAASGVEPTEIDLTAIDFGYESTGAISVPEGGLTVKLENTGAEEHQATIVRLNDGVTLDQFAAAGEAALGLVVGYGGPNAIGPGDAGTASTLVDEGSYLFVCFIPSPSDGVPHAAKGMVLPFEVTASDDIPAEVIGDETIRLLDFTFEAPDDFDGQGTYTIDNAGPQPHEAAVYALQEGATAADMLAFLGGTAPPGPPPFSSAGGISLVGAGMTATVDLDLDAGNYVFVCFIPDATTGAPHFTQGMIQEFEIE